MSIDPRGSITRRRFVQGVGAAAVTTAVACVSADKSGSRNRILGEGDFRYEAIHDWAKLPDRFRWQTTHNIMVDRQGLIYVTHQGSGDEPHDTVYVFDADGKYVRSFGKEFHGGGHGLDVRVENGQEFLYHCDIKNLLVVKTDLKGEHVWKKPAPPEPGVYDKQKYRPTNVAFGSDGGFYIGDGYGSNYIHQYDKDARWMRTWGGTGTDPGKMKTPHGLWLDDRPGRQPALVVADRANARLQYFTLDGEHLGFVHGFGYPAHFDIRDGVLLVPDLHARVTLLDKDNNVIVHLGDDPHWTTEIKKLKIRKDPSQWPAGKFIHPHDACYDAEGNIFVAEWVETGRVTKLRRV